MQLTPSNLEAWPRKEEIIVYGAVAVKNDTASVRRVGGGALQPWRCGDADILRVKIR